MGKQVNFFMMPEDESEFLDFVLKNNEIKIIRVTSDTPEFIIDRPTFERSAKDNIVYFWNSSLGPFTNNISRGSRKEPNPLTGEMVPTGELYYHFDDKGSPIIQFIRSARIVKGELRPGRIWAEATYFDAGQFFTKSKEFKKWYEQLAGWLRRKLKKDDASGRYVSEKVIAWRAQGGVLPNY